MVGFKYVNIGSIDAYWTQRQMRGIRYRDNVRLFLTLLAASLLRPCTKMSHES